MEQSSYFGHQHVWWTKGYATRILRSYDLLNYPFSAAFAVLEVASQTCTAAINALRNPETTVQLDSDSTASLETKLRDFQSLLSLLYQNTTKLAIALKPSNPTYLAAITPGKDLGFHIDALTSCICSIDRNEHGHVLIRELRKLSEDVVTALNAVLAVYLNPNNLHQPRDQQTEVREDGKNEPYLVKTAIVHEAIDFARTAPRSNHEAIKKCWESVLGGVDDCLKEVQEMVEDEERGEESDEDSDYQIEDSDGWEELGVSDARKESVKATTEEIIRMKSVRIPLIIAPHFLILFIYSWLLTQPLGIL